MTLTMIMLVMIGVWEVASILQYDYLNEYYCPEGQCLIQGNGISAGPAVTTLRCRGGEGDELSLPHVWNPIINGDIEPRDLICVLKDMGSYKTEECNPPPSVVYPDTLASDNGLLQHAEHCP